jgi:hypothetical protein
MIPNSSIQLQPIRRPYAEAFHDNKPIDKIKADNIRFDRTLRDELPPLPRLYAGKECVSGLSPGR